jgi:hypothetical protein
MNRLTLLFTFLFLYSCDSATETGANTPGAIPDESTIKKDISSHVKEAKSKNATKWVIDYSGDIEGTIQGGIMMAMPGSSSTQATGMAMTKDMKGKAEESFSLTIVNVSTPPQAFMKLTLADGTQCSNAVPSLNLKVIDNEKETFHAEGSGDLLCGDKKISYTARLNNQP